MSSRREDGHVGQKNRPRHLDIQVELSCLNDCKLKVDSRLLAHGVALFKKTIESYTHKTNSILNPRNRGSAIAPIIIEAPDHSRVIFDPRRDTCLLTCPLDHVQVTQLLV